MSRPQRIPAHASTSRINGTRSQFRPQGGQPGSTLPNRCPGSIPHSVPVFDPSVPSMSSCGQSINPHLELLGLEHTIDPSLLGHLGRSQSDPEKWMTNACYGIRSHEILSPTLQESSQGRFAAVPAPSQPSGVWQHDTLDATHQQYGFHMRGLSRQHWHPVGPESTYYPSAGSVPYSEPDTAGGGYSADTHGLTSGRNGSNSLEDAVTHEVLARRMNEEGLRCLLDSGPHNHNQGFEEHSCNNGNQLPSFSAAGHGDLHLDTPDANKTRFKKCLAKEGTSRSLPASERARCSGENCKKPAPRGRVRCKRCQDKYDRNNAVPPEIEFDPFMSWNTVTSTAYPLHQPLRASASDHSLWENKGKEAEWVGRFINAAATPYDELIGEEPKKFYSDQQETFNGKAFMENNPNGRYTDLWINVRMRMLFRTAVVFHDGGRAVYPVGGDSGGYGRPDISLQFLQRLETIEDEMKVNKLVVMNIIEGKGVIALVENPGRFKKRKIQNKNSNETKNIALEKERKRQKKADARLADPNAGISSDDSDGNDDEELRELLLTEHGHDADAGSEFLPTADRPIGSKRKRNTGSKESATPKYRPSKKARTTASQQQSQSGMQIAPAGSHLPSSLTDSEQGLMPDAASGSRNNGQQPNPDYVSVAATMPGLTLNMISPDMEGDPDTLLSGSASDDALDPRLRVRDEQFSNEYHAFSAAEMVQSIGTISAPDAIHGDYIANEAELQNGAGIFDKNLTSGDHDSPRNLLLPNDFFPDVGFNDFGL